jgi:putative Ca2+/H+ antiporter (TMEM165/GDT1 family)
MFWQTFSAVFVTVFLAELGDKTQLSTMLYASKTQANHWAVFCGSALALVCASAIGVALGSQFEKWIDPKTLKVIAGVLFVAVGLWTIFSE